MSTLAPAKPYDEIFDAQKHYRTLLDCTARPGLIGQLDDVQLEVPAQYNRATAFISLTLFSADTTYFLLRNAGQNEEHAFDTEHAFTLRLTGAKTAPTVNQADFVILLDPQQLPNIDVRIGVLPYPETGATVVAQVEALSPAPIPGSLRLKLTGPGIETETIVFVSGISPEFLETRRELNSEFPVGFDLFLTCDSLSAGPCVLGLPRTTRIEWERI